MVGRPQLVRHGPVRMQMTDATASQDSRVVDEHVVDALAQRAVAVREVGRLPHGRAGTVTRACAVSPGPAVSPANAASVRTGRSGSSVSGPTYIC